MQPPFGVWGAVSNSTEFEAIKFERAEFGFLVLVRRGAEEFDHWVGSTEELADYTVGLDIAWDLGVIRDD